MLKLIPTKDDIITKLKIENDDCKALNIELKNKLTKYERAFEILKDKLDIKLAVCDGLNKKKIYMLISTIHGGIIPKEDKKLLEELMKRENI